MQLLIDSATETPRHMRMAAVLLQTWASLMETGGSINGVDEEITLTDHVHTGPVEAASKRPAAPPIGPAPTPGPAHPLPPGNKPAEPVVHPERHPDAPPPPETEARDTRDPATVFRGPSIGGVTASVIVPAGTNPQTPAAPAGNASLGDVAATGTQPVAAPDAPQTTGAQGAANPPASGSTGTSASSAAAVDKDGIAWDARVHSETRKLNADGTWRFRRNLDPNVKTTVMAELTAAKQVPLPPVAPGPGPGQPADAVAGNVPVPPEAPPVPQQPAAANTLPAAPEPPVTLPPGTVPVQSAADVGVPDPPDAGVVPPPVTGFRQLMTKINTARAAGKLSQEQVNAACAAAKVDGVTALASQPALVPIVDQALNSYLYGVAA